MMFVDTLLSVSVASLSIMCYFYSFLWLGVCHWTHVEPLLDQLGFSCTIAGVV